MWVLEGDTQWLLWVSGTHVVKLGGADAEGQVPEVLVDRYTSLYPSDLNRHGVAEDGAPSAGSAVSEQEEEEALPMPSSLRDDAPI